MFTAVFLLSQGLTVPVFGEASKVRKRIRERLHVLEHASNLPNLQTVLRQKYLKRLGGAGNGVIIGTDISRRPSA